MDAVGDAVTWRVRLALDVAAGVAGMVLATVALIVALDGVEHASALESGVAAWLEAVGRALPGRLAAGLPVATGLGAIAVGAWWRSSGRVVTLEAVGIAPARWVPAVFVGALLAIALASGAREALTPAPTDTPTGWVDLGARWARVSAEHTVVAEFAEGRVQAVGPAEVEAGVLAAAAQPLGPGAPWGRVVAASPSPTRAAWLAERIATPLLALGIAVFGVLAGARSRRAAVGAVAVAVVLSLLQGGGLHQAARGAWPLYLALVPTLLAWVGVGATLARR